MRHFCERKDSYAPVGFVPDKYFYIRYRNDKGEYHGAYQGQYCMWCGKKLDESL
jgi:hypothetical protein